MHDALRVHVVGGLEHLPDEHRRVLLRVAALLDDAVEQLAARHAARTQST